MEDIKPDSSSAPSRKPHHTARYSQIQRLLDADLSFQDVDFADNHHSQIASVHSTSPSSVAASTPLLIDQNFPPTTATMVRRPEDYNYTITADDDFETIDANPRSNHNRTPSSSGFLTSNASDVDSLSEGGQTASTGSAAWEQSDAETIESVNSDNEAAVHTPSDSFSYPDPLESARHGSPRTRDHHEAATTPGTQSKVTRHALRFSDADMKDSEMTVTPLLEKRESDNGRSTEGENKKENSPLTSKARAKFASLYEKAFGSRSKRSVLSFALVSAMLLTVACTAFSTGLLAWNNTVPNPEIEMIFRQEQLRNALKTHDIVDWNSKPLTVTDVLTYPKTYKLGDQNRDVKYEFQTGVVAKFVSHHQLIVSLPKDSRGRRYLSRPSVQVRTFRATVPTLEQFDLIDGLTYVLLDTDDQDAFYYVDVNCGHVSTTVMARSAKDPYKAIKQRLAQKGKADDGPKPFEAWKSAADIRAALQRVSGSVAAGQKDVVEAVSKQMSAMQKSLQKELAIAKVHTTKELNLAAARAKKFLESAGGAMAWTYDEAVDDLTEMRDSLLGRVENVVGASNQLLQDNLKPLFWSVADEVENTANRARRNAKGIVDQVQVRLSQAFGTNDCGLSRCYPHGCSKGVSKRVRRCMKQRGLKHPGFN